MYKSNKIFKYDSFVKKIAVYYLKSKLTGIGATLMISHFYISGTIFNVFII